MEQDIQLQKSRLLINIRMEKIIYTIDKNYYVVRGHPFSRDGGSHGHRKQLAMRLINSIYYEDVSFSWGDNKIFECAHGINNFIGNPTQWV
ncbi:hypothetical protein AB3538_01970 [Acinetobacter baumannii]